MKPEPENPLQSYNPERRFLQLMPVEGYRAVYKADGDEPTTDTVVCFAIVEARDNEYLYSSVVAMVLSEGGTLEPAENMRNFIGVIGPGETPDLL